MAKELIPSKPTLLLLDNFDQVLEAAPLVDELLTVAPRLKILATSRAPLRLYGEQEFPVPLLELPDLKSSEPPQRLTEYEAVRLFVERTRALRPNFSYSRTHRDGMGSGRPARV